MHPARVAPILPVLLALAACTTWPEITGREIWAADIDGPDRVLVMTLIRDDTELSGTGYLALLNSTTAEPLALSGIRVADTVDITFTRPAGDPFHFRGHYTPNGNSLAGVLEGAEFAGLNLSFRRR